MLQLVPSFRSFFRPALPGLVLLLAALAGAPRAESTPRRFEGTHPVRAVATVGMVGDLVAAIAGPHAVVEVLIGPGVDPHLYKATRHDIARLAAADIVFTNGLHLEGKLGDTLATLGRRKPVVAAAEAIDPARLLAGDAAGGSHDPHVWMDVALWREAALAVAAALAEFDPAHAGDYARRAAAVADELARLDAWSRAAFATIPADRRVMITAHDAFRYLGRACDLEVHGIQGLSTESEAGLQDINRLVDLIVARGIPAIFVETSVSDKNVRALVEGAAARGHALRIGGSLYSDAMGEAGTPEGTYVGMIAHNVATIVAALGGEVPGGGFARAPEAGEAEPAPSAAAGEGTEPAMESGR